MASILRFCPEDTIQRREDLHIRPVPELELCMVYRPRPARIVNLNLSCWMLLELCDGRSHREIERAYGERCRSNGNEPGFNAVDMGLRSLVEHQLIRVAAQ